ncbi:thiamine phosphate synthase [Aquimarina gracilis]|uniref:Thiamine phosphate synthase n=1 Tax=Aquimarina gracilis TaxID=874422 RepID=A0ABU6A0B2_9FLAO|nr:thiamine phosphate synthase [Aquimarina gracilis]MEB3347593.1 thiamine phosphate synthase [Aquimarina gracilis]
MLIILTSERAIENEAELINLLFSEGLERLHLRKPEFSINGYRGLLDQIKAQYYDRIMLHEHHELLQEYSLRGIHLQEQARLDLGDALEVTLKVYENKGLKVSSSFHSKEDIVKCMGHFEYVLLSPVFGSISKAGYKGKGFDVTDLDEYVIGMGGINENTLQAACDLGFKGVGVLGGVWNSGDVIESFKIIYDKLMQVKKSLT